MDERLKTLKPGESVTLKGGMVVTFLAAHEPFMLFGAPHGGDVRACRVSQIAWPDPPKAKPGVVYERVGATGGREIAFGLASGKLKRDYHPDGHGNAFDLTPDWQEVPE